MRTVGTQKNILPTGLNGFFRMKNIKIILSVALSAYMLLAIGGFALYRHLCGCQGKEYTTVLPDKSCCSHATETNSCHSHEHHQSKDGENGEPCHCKTQVEFFKVDNTEVSQQVATSFNRFQQILLKSLIVNFDFDFLSDIKLIFNNKEYPPPLSGKLILILHQRLKIPTLLS